MDFSRDICVIVFCLYAVLIQFNQAASDCFNAELCLDWNMTGKELSLFCIVNNAKFSIYIEDNFSNVYADCLPFNPYQCSVYQPKSNVTYSEKGILTFIITRDEHHIPNVWVCRHGSKSVGIRIELTTKSSTDIATSDIDSTPSLWNTISTGKATESNKKESDSLSIIYTTIAAGLGIVVVIVIICNIIIIRLCRRVILPVQIQNTLSTNTNNVGVNASADEGAIQDRNEYFELSAYEIINDIEIEPRASDLTQAISVSLGTQFKPTEIPMGIQTATTERTTTNLAEAFFIEQRAMAESSESSEGSYQEIPSEEDDYLNPYKSLAEENIRKYSTVLDFTTH